MQSSFMLNPESTCSDSDIPGFYYDADKKRYFRLVPGNNNNNPLTTESIRVSQIEKLRIRKRRRRPPRHFLPVTLSNPQRGFASPSVFSNFIQEGRMSSLKCVNKVITESVIELPAEKCKYLCGDAENGMVVGAWISESDGFLIHSLALDVEANNDTSLHINRGSVVNLHPCAFNLADLCLVEVSPKLMFVLYAGSYLNQERESTSTIHLLPIRDQCDLSTSTNRELLDSRSQNYEFVQKHLWSCSFNQCSKTIFAGGESVIYQFGVENGLSSEYSIQNENVFSLATNANGQMLYAGTNKGQLMWFDTRSKNAIGSFKIGRGVSYLKILADENKIVVSSFDDSLAQIDLREKKVLFTYLEHKNTHKKLPFSIDEMTNILCSVGSDQITRLWSLQDGKILTSILPPEMIDASTEVWPCYSDHWSVGSKTCRSCLVMSAGKELLLYSPD